MKRGKLLMGHWSLDSDLTSSGSAEEVKVAFALAPASEPTQPLEPHGSILAGHLKIRHRSDSADVCPKKTPYSMATTMETHLLIE